MKINRKIHLNILPLNKNKLINKKLLPNKLRTLKLTHSAKFMGRERISQQSKNQTQITQVFLHNIYNRLNITINPNLQKPQGRSVGH